jgi:hypothetical protein
MAGENIGVRIDGLNVFAMQLHAAEQIFRRHMEAVARASVTVGAAGAMEEGVVLRQRETDARNLLAEHMTRTANGVGGYQAAAGEIARQYSTLRAVTTETMRQILRPTDAPPGQDQIFDPTRVIAEKNTVPPDQAGGN